MARKTAQMCALFAMIFVAMPESLQGGEYVRVVQGKSVFHLYRARADELSIHWKDADGGAMRTFDALRPLGRFLDGRTGFLEGKASVNVSWPGAVNMPWRYWAIPMDQECVEYIDSVHKIGVHRFSVPTKA